jgi:hypothetical protein
LRLLGRFAASDAGYAERWAEVMTGLTDRAAAANRRIIYSVKTHGWHVMKIMSKSQDPSEAFMIGLSRMSEMFAPS